MSSTKEMKAHLAANLTPAVLLWIAVLFAVWRTDALHLVLKIVLTPITLLACAYVGHRVLPKLTGPFVEAAFGKRED